MGRKGNWFSNVKKALSPDSKDKTKDEKSSKSKKKWFGKQKHNPSSDPSVAATLPPLPQQEDAIEVTYVEIQRQSRDDQPMAADPTIVPSVAAPAAAPPAVLPEVVAVQTSTMVPRFIGKSGEEAAAIKIQTAFRGYLARRALRALRGLVRLKLLMEGSVVKRQASNTLKCMQTLARVQSQVRSRRIRMLEENQALQRQLLQKHAKELENLRLGEEWDDSLQSKEQIEASLLNKYEASVRRERALAYAFSHQQTLKNPIRSANPMFMDPRNPSWGWSWLERWMAARPWENRGGPNDKDSTNDASSVRSRNVSVGGEINKSYARYILNSEKLSSPTATQKPPPASPAPSSTPPATTKPVSAKKVKSASPRIAGSRVQDEDARSATSAQSDRFRRHSIGGGSSVRDDESLASSPALPSYMVPTESARAKSRLNSPFSGGEKNGSTTPERSGGPVESAKKRLSFPPSPGGAKPRRHSGPPKVEASSATVTAENNETNGIAVA